MKLSLIFYICFLILSYELCSCLIKKNHKKKVNDIDSGVEKEMSEKSFKWNNLTYTFSNSCENNCHKRGICLDDKCYCDDGYVGKHCDRERHKDVKNYYYLSNWILWIIISSIGVSFLTLLILFSCDK